MSGVDTGASERRLTRSNRARSTRTGSADGSGRAKALMICLANSFGLGVNDWGRASGKNEVTDTAETHVRVSLASKHTLKERHGFGRSARAR